MSFRISYFNSILVVFLVAIVGRGLSKETLDNLRSDFEDSAGVGLSPCAEKNSEDCFGSISNVNKPSDGLAYDGKKKSEKDENEKENNKTEVLNVLEDDLAKEVTEAFTDIGELLNEQLKSLSDLQNTINKQVQRVQHLQQIASKGFPAYQQQQSQTSQPPLNFPQHGGYRGGAIPHQVNFAPQASASSFSGSHPGSSSNSLVTPSTSVGLDKTVAKFRAGWFDHMALQSAVKVDSEVSALLVLPQDGGEGLARYIAIGDVEGKVYIFRPQGELIIEFHSGIFSPVTALSAYVIRRNETMLMTGHQDGSITSHKIGEQIHLDSQLPDDLFVLTVVHKVTASLARHSGASATRREGEDGDAAEASQLVEVDAALGPVAFIESFRAAQMRFIVAVNHQGEMTVLKENGTLHGTARTGARVVRLRAGGAYAVYVTENGVGALDLLTLHATHDPCKHMNETRLVSASFDSVMGSKVYALTSEGEILTLFLGGERKTECSVRSRRAAGVAPPGALAPIKGYLLAATSQEVWAFNTTGSTRSGPRYVLQDDLDKVGQSFGHTPSLVCSEFPPMLAYNKQRQVVVSLCNGLVGIFESHLPITTPPQWNPKLWSQPLFIGAIVLVAMWQFYSQKRKGGGGGMDDPAEIMRSFNAANSRNKAGGGAGYQIPDDLMNRVSAASSGARRGNGRDY